MKLPQYTTFGRLKSHLSLIHGMYVGDVKELAGLLEAHADSHENPDRPYYLDHTHDAGVGSEVTPGSGSIDDHQPVTVHPDGCTCPSCDVIEEWTW